MTTSHLDGHRLNRDFDGVHTNVLVTGARLHAWNQGRHGALNAQQVENKAGRMANAALHKAGAKADERWSVVIEGDDVSGHVTAERIQ